MSEGGSLSDMVKRLGSFLGGDDDVQSVDGKVNSEQVIAALLEQVRQLPLEDQMQVLRVANTLLRARKD